MNTDVPGSPESCRATADALHRVVRQLEDADRLATRGARTPECRFDGRTADAYRASCAALADSAAAHATSARRAAGALASYANELAAVQRVMERVRRSAGVHGLLKGTELVPPAAPTPHQTRVLERLSTITADALAHLERARDRLGAAFPGQPFPADYGNVLLPPVDEPFGPFPFPPPESAWPREDRDDEPREDRLQRDRPDRDRPAPEADQDPPDAEDGTGDGSGGEPRGDHPHGDQWERRPDPPRFHCGDPTDDTDVIGYDGSDRARPPGHVLRPEPEPVP